MSQFATIDILAVSFFFTAWIGYAIAIERASLGSNSLNARMNIYREVWMRRLLDRDLRMMDMQVMGSLQNGTAFFASTTLLAIGGGLTLLRATDEASAISCHAHDEALSIRRASFQPRTTRILLRTRLSRLVHQSMDFVCNHDCNRRRDVAAPIRIRRMASNGTLNPEGLHSDGRCVMALA